VGKSQLAFGKIRGKTIVALFSGHGVVVLPQDAIAAD